MVPGHSKLRIGGVSYHRNLVVPCAVAPRRLKAQALELGRHIRRGEGAPARSGGTALEEVARQELEVRLKDRSGGCSGKAGGGGEALGWQLRARGEDEAGEQETAKAES
jgi:hypothetical protein